MNCPDCQSEMIEINQRGVTIDRCEFCGNLWFDPNEIYRFLCGQNGEPGFGLPDDSSFTLAPSPTDQRCARCAHPSIQSGVIYGVSYKRCSACEGISINSRGVSRIRRNAIKRSAEKTSPPTPTEHFLMAVVEIAGKILEGAIVSI